MGVENTYCPGRALRILNRENSKELHTQLSNRIFKRVMESTECVKRYHGIIAYKIHNLKKLKI